MSFASRLQALRPWPRTLGARLFLILLAGLIVAHGLSFGVLFLERYTTAEAMMLGALQSDVATSVAILDRLPAGERSSWLARLDRGNYHYVLGPGQSGMPDTGGQYAEVAKAIGDAAGLAVPVRLEFIGENQIQAHLTLSDGNPLTLEIAPEVMPLADWLPYVLVVQLLLLIGCSWFAVRLAIRPLVRLADAADTLDPNGTAPRLSETGPREVAYAASAFNSMRDRIAQYLAERVQILAAISHDLQTPITRMKLRAELAEESAEKHKLVQDLAEIERLVQEGIAYARSAHGHAEKSARIDIGSFLESLVYDYQDTGKEVVLTGSIDAALVTKPHALRRILTNFLDNALKFAGDAEVQVEQAADGAVSITVLDRGPGIPQDQLQAVLQPFFRLDQSRNRGTGGTGLGLAIAQQLATAIGGTLTLSNRPDGGLAARIVIR